MQVLADTPVDVILSDYRMPSMNGVEFLQRARELQPHSVRLILSAFADLQTVTLALNESVIFNFLAKPWDDGLLRAHLKEAFARAVLIRENQRLRTFEDIDPLTGIANRAFLCRQLQSSLNKAASGEQALPALIMIDLDRFKNVNACFGHNAADGVLVELATRLSEALPPECPLARVSGDEFLLLVPDVTAKIRLVRLAQSILACLEQPFAVGDSEVRVACSVGIGIANAETGSARELLVAAESAVRRAKSEGGNGYEVCQSTQTRDTDIVIENHLRGAIEREELYLVYQPQYEVQSGELCGMEALLRWKHPELGEVDPERFIPIAESSGMIKAMGNWVIRQACLQLRHWQIVGYGDWKVSINLSPRQLVDPDLVTVTAGILDDVGLDPSCLAFEITESVVVSNFEQASGSLHQLKSLGIQLLLDDFGTGYASLGYLNKLPIDAIKIDRSFIQDIDGSGDRVALVAWMIGIAHQLRLGVVAEGVETSDQLAFLHRHGCDKVQGYLLNRPQNASAITALLEGIYPDATAGKRVPAGTTRPETPLAE